VQVHFPSPSTFPLFFEQSHLVPPPSFPVRSAFPPQFLLLELICTLSCFLPSLCSSSPSLSPFGLMLFSPRIQFFIFSAWLRLPSFFVLFEPRVLFPRLYSVAFSPFPAPPLLNPFLHPAAAFFCAFSPAYTQPFLPFLTPCLLSFPFTIHPLSHQQFLLLLLNGFTTNRRLSPFWYSFLILLTRDLHFFFAAISRPFHFPFPASLTPLSLGSKGD